MKASCRSFSAAAYIRLSREDGDKAESNSIGNQKKLILDYIADKEEITLFDIYIDDGFTGTNFTRPSFQKMIGDIESHAINCVIVKDLSRFGRDYIDTGKYLERYFPDRNVRFISITDNIDSIKRPYDLLLPIKNIFNEQYARDISEKIHASVSTKQKAGEFIGAFASYGYRKSPSDKNKLIVDEYPAEIIRQIFDLYIKGCGKLRIASILNEQGIVCPSEYKKLKGENYQNSNRLDSTSYWTYSTINRILHNELYTGAMVQGRKIQHMRGKPRARDKSDWIIVRNTHEPIIDESTWKKAQDLLERRTRTPSLHTNVSVFAGFLKCGDCGRSLTKKTSSPKRQGILIRYYCGSYVRSGRQYCTPHSISHEFLEKIILEDLQALLLRTPGLEKIAEGMAAVPGNRPSLGTGLPRLKEELKKIQRIKQTLYEDYKEEFISKDEYLLYRENYSKKENLLKEQLKNMVKQQSPPPASGLYEDPWIRRLLNEKTIEGLDRKIVVEMIDRIEVYENHRIRIVYNFSPN